MSEKELSEKKLRPVLLVILDGWGIGEEREGNVLLKANIPTIKKINAYYPGIALQASGISVGLPWGEPGNSEVGHLTLGSGKVIYQSMPRITMSIQNGEFYKNPVFLEAIEKARKNNKAVHLMGLLGKGSVHSNTGHLYAFLELLRDQKMKNVFLHLFTDGRDSSPTSAVESIKELKERMQKYGVGKIASISGRYFGMDRNNNWDRVEKSYSAMVRSAGNKIDNADEIEKYINDSYQKEIFDEYMEPAVIFEDGKPVGPITDEDSLIFFNYREDRARQITQSFVVPGFSKFKVEDLKNLFFVAMTEYEENIPIKVAFPPIKINECLGKVISEKKLTQLRISETEKFAHVTYFFNGGQEDPFPGEDRIIIPSKDVPSFDKAPKMSALEVTQKVIENIERDKYDFILINFANADIVGHTAVEKACIEAVETLDQCLEKIVPLVLKKNGCLLITADHGNVEEIINYKTGEKDTEHSSNPVPLWFITPDNHRKEPLEENVMPVSGILSDIAPTVLDILGTEKSPEMTGESLLDYLK